ncbi:MAG: ExbD/TolR family protein [Candidatus Melainabacteria bacterium]
MALGAHTDHKKTFNEINITPLTDIFLVLLIIMMVVAPLMQQMRKDISPPKIASTGKVDQGLVTVEVTSGGEFYVKSEPVSAAELTDRLKTLIDAESVEKNVVIRADKATKSGVVMTVLSAARDAGYDKVTVAGEPLSEGRQNALATGNDAREVQ